MNIVWHGFSCFKIEGQKATVIVDPFDGKCGLRQPRYTADIVVSTTDAPLYNNVGKIKDNDGNPAFVITGPGEYEVKGVFVHAVGAHEDEKKAPVVTLYKLDIDEISIATLGSLSHGVSDAELEKLEGAHILLIPVGGQTVLDAKQAAQIISQIEPRIVIPMHYKVPGVKLKLDTLDAFKKEIGVAPELTLSKFKVAKKDLPSQGMKVVVMQP